ncbi:hypothetical protein FSS13T_17220 [Flavobacterium saliperosum S13]|uniref:Uncharacterized membrane protein n=2 Tax=Flavobacterium saliperosum TaxID=329186 RepID=A0A1G4VIU4_9FLAO|nr:DUF2231 domain-containing protein [Flavobacterium saliperosum]ESU25486.1 hypothetical protein FSS13T_17220 [Flavobacterium saliperosum S13]SCX07421.1 Uncharacterized membrane protein [Flavobacterium saliperosum]
MNDAHLHLLVNHFPILGTIFGLGILIVGLLLKNKSMQHTAYVLFAIAAIFGLLSMNTGEGAEELVEDLPNVGKEIIHEHEEIAEKFVILLYLTGAVALLSLLMSVKNHAKAKFFAYATLLLAIGTAVLSKNVGTSGGEIRHTEIRGNASVNGVSAQENGTEATDEEH